MGRKGRTVGEEGMGKERGGREGVNALSRLV